MVQPAWRRKGEKRSSTGNRPGTIQTFNLPPRSAVRGSGDGEQPPSPTPHGSESAQLAGGEPRTRDVSGQIVPSLTSRSPSQTFGQRLHERERELYPRRQQSWALFSLAAAGGIMSKVLPSLTLFPLLPPICGSGPKREAVKSELGWQLPACLRFNRSAALLEGALLDGVRGQWQSHDGAK